LIRLTRLLQFPDHPSSQAGLDHLHRLVLLRWWTIAGQSFAIAFAHWVVGAVLQLAPMFTAVGMLAAFNVVTALRLKQRPTVSPRELFAQLCVDFSALTVLLFFSGGAANPLASLYLLPIALAAVILPAQLAWTLALLGVALYSLLTFFRVPLTVADYLRANALHLFGTWFTYALCAMLIAWFLVQMTSSIRQRDRELATARETALRNERIVALGSLAAGAAHELGTPLGSLAILVDELLLDPSSSDSQRELLLTMKSELARCKTTITSLAARAGEARAEGGRLLALDEWLESVFEDWRKTPGATPLTLSLRGPRPAPRVVAEATIEQALRNLLDNAARASRASIECECGWNERELRVAIHDRGPGFPAEVLEAAGRRFLSTRHAGSGIGLYLAFSTIERHGGDIGLANRADGGATVELMLPLASLRAAAESPDLAQTESYGEYSAPGEGIAPASKSARSGPGSPWAASHQPMVADSSPRVPPRRRDFDTEPT
jgi:two-component system sensor histidine kinase RegB